jgi:hypothetical protein
MRVNISKGGNTEIVCTKSEWEAYGKKMGWTENISKEASGVSIRLVEDESGKKSIKMNRAGWEHIGKTAGFDEDVETEMAEMESPEETIVPYIEEPAEEDDDDIQEDFQEDDQYIEFSSPKDEDNGSNSIDRIVHETEERLVEGVMSGVSDGQVPAQLVPEAIVAALDKILDVKGISSSGDPIHVLQSYVYDAESINDREEGVKDIVRNQLRIIMDGEF